MCMSILFGLCLHIKRVDPSGKLSTFVLTQTKFLGKNSTEICFILQLKKKYDLSVKFLMQLSDLSFLSLVLTAIYSVFFFTIF